MDTTLAPTRPQLADRDRSIDAYRAFAMLVVVAWHWVFTIATWGPRGPRVDNPISFVPALGYLTWVLQVMPLFFLVGGHLTARSLRGRDATETRRWVQRRATALVRPALPLLGGLVLAHVLAESLGAHTVARAIVLTATPMWFLAVYLGIVLVAPAVQPLARRWPVGHVVALAAWCVVWDLARVSGVVDGQWLWLSMLMVWLTVHQLGGLLDRLDRRRARTLVLGGVVALVAATAWGPYPVSMVGTTSDRISNMGPPTAVLLALALVQLGLVVLTRDRVRAVARRHPGAVDAMATHAMPVYLWHMIGFAVCVVVCHAVGVALPARPTGGWWLARPVWVVFPALVAWPLVRWSVERSTRGHRVRPT